MTRHEHETAVWAARVRAARDETVAALVVCVALVWVVVAVALR